MRWWNWLKRLFGTPGQRRLARGALAVKAIRYWEKQYTKLSATEILQTAQQLRGRARGGESLDGLVPEVFGLV